MPSWSPFTGDLDLATAPTLRHRLRTILDGCRGGYLKLDLAAVSFCDIAGLRALQAVGRDAARAQYQAQIISAGRSLDVLLGICQLPTALGHAPPPSADTDGG